MIKYVDLVEYIKENHINWNTDLFEVLRGFFEEYTSQQSSTDSEVIIEQDLIFPDEAFIEPEDGEYSVEDLMHLLN